jgi:hypothetical protein
VPALPPLDASGLSAGFLLLEEQLTRRSAMAQAALRAAGARRDIWTLGIADMTGAD